MGLKGSVHDFGGEVAEGAHHRCDTCPFCFACKQHFPTYCKGRDHNVDHRNEMFYAYGQTVDASLHSCGCSFCLHILRVKTDLDYAYPEAQTAVRRGTKWQEIKHRGRKRG